MNVNNTEDIHATIINNTPISMLTQDRQYRYGGYVGRVTIDLTDNDPNKIINIEAIETPHRLPNNKSSNVFIDDENEFHSETYADESRERLFRSNTEIFNQILKVRKDIDSLKREIRKVKEFVQYMNLNFSKYNTNPIQQTTLIDNSGDANFRLHQFANNFSSKRNIYTTTKPAYIAFPQTISIISPILMSRLQANAAAPALEENLSNENEDGGDVATNSAKFPFEISFKSNHKMFRNEEGIIEFNRNRQFHPLVNSGNTENQNQLNGTRKSSAVISINEGCNKNGKILRKSAIENETLINKKEELFQLQSTTTSANFQLLVTVLSPNSEKELPNISVTQAYQPFSITRYTARSKINFDKGIDKLITFNKSKSPLVAHRLLNPASVTLISNHTFPPAIQSSLSYLSSSTSSLEFDNKSHAVILSFASPKASKTLNHATTTRSPPLLLSTTISNTVATIVVGTYSAINATTTTASITTTTTFTTTITTTTSSNIITRGITSSTSETVRPMLGFEKISRHNSNTMPPLIPLKPNFFGKTFDGIFVPWFNDPQFTLWPEVMFRRG